MKWGLILVLCILFSLNYVSAGDITLGIGEDYTEGNVRITLARIGSDYEKVVLCINNEEQIVYEDQLAYFKDASLEVEHIDNKDKTVDIDIDWLGSCSHCKCEDDCLNDKCKIQTRDEFGDFIKTDEIEEDNTEVDVVEENVEVSTKSEEVLEYKLDYVLAASIPLIGIFIGIVLVWLLWFRKMSF